MIRLGIAGGNRGKIAVEILPYLKDAIELGYIVETQKEFDSMLHDPSIDAVYIATPLAMHAEQSIQALAAGKHVLCEVPACTTLEEGAALKVAAKKSKKIYFLAESYCYIPENLSVRDMCGRGELGTITFVRSEYLHDCKHLFFSDDSGSLTWRGEIQRQEPGHIYPTHSIGPLAQFLNFNGEDSIKTISAFHTSDASIGEFVRHTFGKSHPLLKEGTRGDSTVVILETRSGTIIELRYDTHTDRPSSKAGLLIQGTKGTYISGRHDGEKAILFRRGEESFAEAPPPQIAEPSLFEKLGRRYPEYLMLRDFSAAVQRGAPLPWTVEDAILWSSIIPLSSAALKEKRAIPFKLP